uniref:Uncharacterized protein n=1 Tax=Romanomermis culicivorax TaxID=13658 RepID=A0A915KFH0_ROMCU
MYSVKGHSYLSLSAERNGMLSTQCYRTKGKFSFRSVPLEVTVGHFLENCSYPFRSKPVQQTECFNLLAIGSVPSKMAKFSYTSLFFNQYEHCENQTTLFIL